MDITIENNQFNLDNPNLILGSGKEATVYNLNNNYAAKILNEQSLSQNKTQKILALCDKSDYLSEIKGFDNIAIPIYPAYHNDKILGYSMTLFKDCTSISELYFDIIEKQYSFNSITDEIVFKIIEKMFDTLQVLHRQKIILGDINSNNILWNSKTNEVHIIDLDSAKVGEFYSSMSTAEYLCPIVKKIGTAPDGGLSFSTSSDIYALTIICFEILLGVHPCDVNIKPILNNTEKIDKGITYFNFHFQKKSRHKNYTLFDKDSFNLVAQRLDQIKSKSPNIYNHFVNVFLFKKRNYLQEKKIVKTFRKKTLRKIKPIRTRYRNKQYDPKELAIFLKSYNLNIPYYEK